MQQQPLTVRQFCEKYQISKNTFYRWVRDGRIRTTKLSESCVRVMPEAEQAWLESRGAL
jgi:excisionase family DNA binding protein